MSDTPARTHPGGGRKGKPPQIKNKSSGALECC